MKTRNKNIGAKKLQYFYFFVLTYPTQEGYNKNVKEDENQKYGKNKKIGGYL